MPRTASEEPGVTIGAHVPKGLRDRVDAWAKSRSTPLAKVTRSAAIEALLEAGLAASAKADGVKRKG